MKKLKEFKERIAIIGGGNLGQAITMGLLKSKKVKPIFRNSYIECFSQKNFLEFKF